MPVWFRAKQIPSTSRSSEQLGVAVWVLEVCEALRLQGATHPGSQYLLTPTGLKSVAPTVTDKLNEIEPNPHAQDALSLLPATNKPEWKRCYGSLAS